MDLTRLLSGCKSAVKRRKYAYKIVSRLPPFLLIILCGCMLWQCSTCLIKYSDSPMGARVAYNQDLSVAPISITVCNKNPNLTYSFPELASVDVRSAAREIWVPVWSAASLNLSAVFPADKFVISDERKQLRICMTININSSSISELRIHHYYSDICYLSNINVYLHGQGLFLAPDFSLPIDKSLFLADKNYILDLTLETMESLPTEQLKCSQSLAQTLDSCILEEAWKGANQSAGCIAKYLR